MVSLPVFTPCTNDEPLLTGLPKALLSVYPAEVVFGNSVLGEESAEATILLKNDGYDDVAITDIIAVGDFVNKSNVIVQILAAQTIALQVAFSPGKVGLMTGGLHIEAAGASGIKFVKLTGTGILTPTAIPTFHQLIGLNNTAYASVNITGGVYALVASGTFAGASLQLQWRPDEITAWTNIGGAILDADTQSIYGIPLTVGMVRGVLAGGTASTSITSQLAW